MAKIKKKIKTITVDADKCNGCRGCEIVCSGFHSIPKYSTINPARSRIQVVFRPLEDIWLPIFAGEYSPAECMGREKYLIDEKNYDECEFCRASCPARDRFKEPDSGLPLRCDMCEDEPELEQPKCVEWCINDVLVYEVREEEVDEEESIDDVEIGLQSLVDKHGLKKIVETFTRMSQKD
ncbi:MAG: (4Fe-4S)-binding protein [Desulfotomaculaceae bacterium]|nr:(4Fe-4S)-binding protein [Desulfotomaculaceae bacterium]